MKKGVFKAMIIVIGIITLAIIGILWYKEWNAKKDFLTPMPELTATLEPTATNTPTPEPTATNTPTPEPTATNTPTPEPTATNTPTPEPTATNTPTPEPTATNTPTPKPTATNTPTPKPTATNTPTPTPETLPYVSEGRILMDVRKNPECLNNPLLALGDLEADSEYKKAYKKMLQYGAYMPMIEMVTTYDPWQKSFGYDIWYTVPMYDGGTYYIKRDKTLETNLSINLATALVSFFDDYKGGFAGNVTSDTNLPLDDGVNYISDLSFGEVTYVIRYYVYYVD